jgi:hypothetical protein
VKVDIPLSLEGSTPSGLGPLSTFTTGFVSGLYPQLHPWLFTFKPFGLARFPKETHVNGCSSLGCSTPFGVGSASTFTTGFVSGLRPSTPPVATHVEALWACTFPKETHVNGCSSLGCSTPFGVGSPSTFTTGFVSGLYPSTPRVAIHVQALRACTFPKETHVNGFSSLGCSTPSGLGPCRHSPRVSFRDFIPQLHPWLFTFKPFGLASPKRGALWDVVLPLDS